MYPKKKIYTISTLKLNSKKLNKTKFYEVKINNFLNTEPINKLYKINDQSYILNLKQI